MNITSIPLQIGPYQVLPILTGRFALDGGAMFGTVPKVLWQKMIPSDEQNRIPMEARALLLKSPNHNLLIDTGNGHDFIQKYGPKLGQKFADMYAIDQAGPNLIKSLAHWGVAPQDIDTVILTHLHFDHAGGATYWDGQKLVPTFAKANYLLQHSNLVTAQTPNSRERASYFAANFQPLIEAQQLTLLEGSHQINSHIRVTVSDGHTQGQQNVWVEDQTKSLFYGADLIPTHAHIRTSWIMGYDLDPLTLIQEKTQILEEVAHKNSYLFFEHDPFMDAAQITKTAQGDFTFHQGFALG